MNQRQHDMGGMDAGPIESSAHDAEPWAKMITSLAAAMRDDGRSAAGHLFAGLFRTLV